MQQRWRDPRASTRAKNTPLDNFKQLRHHESAAKHLCPNTFHPALTWSGFLISQPRAARYFLDQLAAMRWGLLKGATMATTDELLEALGYLATAPVSAGRTRMIDRVLDELAEVQGHA